MGYARRPRVAQPCRRVAMALLALASHAPRAQEGPAQQVLITAPSARDAMPFGHRVGREPLDRARAAAGDSARLLQDVPAEEFVKSIDKGIARNSAADAAALDARREEFDRRVRALGSVHKGDVVDLDFLPGQGMVFAYNGQRQGEPIEGEAFYAAVLRIFLGAQPVDAQIGRAHI